MTSEDIAQLCKKRSVRWTSHINVPSRVCSQCGEASYSDEVARQIERIVQGIIASASAEIAVVSYSEKAA